MLFLSRTLNPLKGVVFSNQNVFLLHKSNSLIYQAAILNKYKNHYIPLSFRLYSSETQQSPPEKSKLRKFYDEYGKLGIAIYLGISVVSVSSFYTAIKLGVNLEALLEKLNLQDNKLVSKAGPLALAYGIHKLFAPLRLVLAFVLTPVVKKRFFPNMK